MAILPAIDNQYRINGVLMDMAPVSVQWGNHTLGYQGNGAPITSAYWDVTLSFQGGVEAWITPWLNHLGYPVEVQIPNKWGLDFVLLTDVYFDLQAAPTLTDVNWGVFTLVIKGVLVV